MDKEAKGGIGGEYAVLIYNFSPIQTGAFVIASEEKKVFRILYFVRQQQAHGFDGLLASGTEAEKMVINSHFFAWLSLDMIALHKRLIRQEKPFCPFFRELEP